MRTALLLTVLLSTAAPAAAQSLPIDKLTPPLPSQTARTVADVASWGTVIAAVALDAKATIGGCSDQDRCYHAVLFTGLRVGATFGAVLAVKHLVHRQRPCAPECGIDNPDYSFFSGHTALAFSTIGGPRLSVALPLAVSTGGLRIAAGKHYLTDVLAGAGVGLLTSRIR